MPGLMQEATPATIIDGVARCARYAFGPNKLHLCGPDANREVLAYLQAGASDAGLGYLMRGFQTLYPYLKQISAANRIRDPFDERVVEAYWIGNELLETIPTRRFYHYLADVLRLKDRYDPKSFKQIADKLPQGARMHHSFHVLNVFKKNSPDAVTHSVENMDSCRVSWGRITAVDGSKIGLSRKPLVLVGHQLALGPETESAVHRKLEDDFLENVSVGDLLTMHWKVPCELITDKQAQQLQHYTLKHIALANQTL